MKYSLSVSHNIALTPTPTPLLLTVNNTRVHAPTHAHRDLRSVALQVKCRIWEKDTAVGQILLSVANSYPEAYTILPLCVYAQATEHVITLSVLICICLITCVELVSFQECPSVRAIHP